MTHLDRLHDWLVVHRAELERLGRVTYVRGPEDRPNPSANLVVNLDDVEVELLLWTTGEAEFNHGTFDDPVFEHVQVESPEDLDTLLRRFLGSVPRRGS